MFQPKLWFHFSACRLLSIAFQYRKDILYGQLDGDWDEDIVEWRLKGRGELERDWIRRYFCLPEIALIRAAMVYCYNLKLGDNSKSNVNHTQPSHNRTLCSVVGEIERTTDRSLLRSWSWSAESVLVDLKKIVEAPEIRVLWDGRDLRDLRCHFVCMWSVSMTLNVHVKNQHMLSYSANIEYKLESLMYVICVSS